MLLSLCEITSIGNDTGLRKGKQLRAPTVHMAQTAAHSLDAPTHQRTEKEFLSARRHSWLVAVMKKALPLSAIAIVVIFASKVVFSFSPIANVSIDAASIQDGKLIMNTPVLNGFNANNKAYFVKALKAIQDLSKPDDIFLEKLTADLPMDTGIMANITSDKGAYNSKTEKLNLSENVVIKAGDGMEILMHETFVDIKSGTMSSDRPVVVKTNDTEIKADSIRVIQNGDNIIFNGRVRMTIKAGSGPMALPLRQ